MNRGHGHSPPYPPTDHDHGGRAGGPTVVRMVERGQTTLTKLTTLTMLAASQPSGAPQRVGPRRSTVSPLERVAWCPTKTRARSVMGSQRERRQARPKKSDRPLCGARCRSRGGAPCVARVVVDRDGTGAVRVRKRCRMHGGLSTGPRTTEGRRRISDAARERWRRWREEQARERQ